jgi:hypothetical protein
MAKVVDPDKVWVPQATRGPLHDWAKFCDGQTWQLKRGEDFAADANLNSARSSFRQWAKRHGYDMTRVRTAVPDDDTLVIQVIDGREAPGRSSDGLRARPGCLDPRER